MQNPNVKLASKRIEVDWGEIGVVLAELSCINLLSFSKWMYFINLPGREFPLRTNNELMKISKIYNDYNDREGTNKRFVTFSRISYIKNNSMS